MPLGACLRERVVVHSHSVAVHSHPFLALWQLPAAVGKSRPHDKIRVDGFLGIETVLSGRVAARRNVKLFR